jgi:hypothetical protein
MGGVGSPGRQLRPPGFCGRHHGPAGRRHLSGNGGELWPVNAIVALLPGRLGHHLHRDSHPLPGARLPPPAHGQLHHGRHRSGHRFGRFLLCLAPHPDPDRGEHSAAQHAGPAEVGAGHGTVGRQTRLIPDPHTPRPASAAPGSPSPSRTTASRGWRRPPRGRCPPLGRGRRARPRRPSRSASA